MANSTKNGRKGIIALPGVDDIFKSVGVIFPDIWQHAKRVSRRSARLTNSHIRSGQSVLLPPILMRLLLLRRPVFLCLTSSSYQKMSRRESQSEFLPRNVSSSRFSDIATTYRPDPYLLGAKRCGVDPKRCLVLEDAPAGIQSGRAAGCQTLGVITSHTREQVEAAKPDFIVQNLAR